VPVTVKDVSQAKKELVAPEIYRQIAMKAIGDVTDEMKNPFLK